MAKTFRTLIADALADISDEDLERFRMLILEQKKEGPRIRRNQVDKKNYLELSCVLVDAYTGYRAIEVTEKHLRAINCNRVADELVEEADELKEAQPTNTHSRGAPGAPGAPTQKPHFVDLHRNELIERVSNIDPILDQLLSQRVVTQEQYDEIRSLSTSQKKMRFIFSNVLKTSKTKDIFLSAVENQEPYLTEDLKGSEA